MNARDLLFGGKTFVLGGDFRQTLPVKKGVTKEKLIAASIVESHLWWYFKIWTLKENIRLLRSDLTNKERQYSEAFSKWLLDVSNNEIGEPNEENDEDNYSVMLGFKVFLSVVEVTAAGYAVVTLAPAVLILPDLVNTACGTNLLLGGDARLKLKELMELCTKLSDRVLDLEKTKTAQAKEITDLKKRVKKL
nr:DNA helicase [Tanacetum cinerariifolium]